MAKILDQNDLNSPTWAKLRAHLEEMLANERRLNDASAPMDVTEKRRGKIEMLVTLLGIDAPQKPVPKYVERDLAGNKI